LGGFDVERIKSSVDNVIYPARASFPSNEITKLYSRLPAGAKKSGILSSSTTKNNPAQDQEQTWAIAAHIR